MFTTLLYLGPAVNFKHKNIIYFNNFASFGSGKLVPQWEWVWVVDPSKQNVCDSNVALFCPTMVCLGPTMLHLGSTMRFICDSQ